MAEESTTGVYVKLRELVRLRFEARGFSYLSSRSGQALCSGRTRSRLRGRGLDFEEIRHYRAGDDVRAMDWRITTRTGKPHVRVYTEERDRPVFVLVDQRQSMFFGSVLMTKSVLAADTAAVTAWRVLADGDRVAGVVFNDHDCEELKPTREPARLIWWLGRLQAMNRSLSARSLTVTQRAGLNTALERARGSIGHDCLVVVVSDFQGFGTSTLKLLASLSRHNDLVCLPVHDPLERDIAQADGLLVSDGAQQFQIEGGNSDFERRFSSAFDQEQTLLYAALRRAGATVLPLWTSSPAVNQLREQLPSGRGRR
jgi:uncharacterized protein (DUF58 family)